MKPLQKLRVSYSFVAAILVCAAFVQVKALRTLTSESQILSTTTSLKPSKAFELKAFANIPDFGFRNILANWSFLSFLEYFGDNDSRKETGYDLSPDYMRVVLKYDPYYRPFYFFLSESTTFYAAMPDKSVSLTEKGLSFFEDNKPSDSYYIWRYKGIDELLFLNDSKASQQSFKMAARWATESNDVDSNMVAALSTQTAEFLASNLDSSKAKISAWSSILMSTNNMRVRKRAIREINALGGIVSFDGYGKAYVEYSSPEELRTADAPKM